jgi:hypothetical protein
MWKGFNIHYPFVSSHGFSVNLSHFNLSLGGFLGDISWGSLTIA